VAKTAVHLRQARLAKIFVRTLRSLGANRKFESIAEAKILPQSQS